MLKEKGCALMLHVAPVCEDVALDDPICYCTDVSILSHVIL